MHTILGDLYKKWYLSESKINITKSRVKNVEKTKKFVSLTRKTKKLQQVFSEMMRTMWRVRPEATEVFRTNSSCHPTPGLASINNVDCLEAPLTAYKREDSLASLLKKLVDGDCEVVLRFQQKQKQKSTVDWQIPHFQVVFVFGRLTLRSKKVFESKSRFRF